MSLISLRKAASTTTTPNTRRAAHATYFRRKFHQIFTKMYGCWRCGPIRLSAVVGSVGRTSDTTTGLGGTGGLVCLEVNTQPGMTATSLVPEMAAYAGMRFRDAGAVDGGGRVVRPLASEHVRCRRPPRPAGGAAARVVLPRFLRRPARCAARAANGTCRADVGLKASLALVRWPPAIAGVRHRRPRPRASSRRSPPWCGPRHRPR